MTISHYYSCTLLHGYYIGSEKRHYVNSNSWFDYKAWQDLFPFVTCSKIGEALVIMSILILLRVSYVN